jgi:putative ABC transport system permease protein
VLATLSPRNLRRKWRRFIDATLRRDRFEAQMADEMRFHVEAYASDLVQRGVPPGEAARRARMEFGALDVAKDECRDVRPSQWLDSLVRDTRLGFRALGRERTFALSVIFILGVGIAATVAMYSVLNGVVLRPLPYARPDELAILSTHAMLQNQFDGTSGANFEDWRTQSKLFASMALYRRTSVSRVVFAGADAPQRAQEGLVGPDFFEVLGAPALVGRTFAPEEFASGERVVVLSESLWQEQFGGQRNAIGGALRIAGESYRIIGVMPRSFQFPTVDTRLWRPISVLGRWWQGAQRARDGDSFEVIGRLAPNSTIEDARAEMKVIAARLRDGYPENHDLDVRVTRLADHVVDAHTRRGLWLSFGAVLSLLAIACANAAGLMAARATRRRRELVVRAALGAGRSRLIGQLLAEAASLWAVASAIGLIFAYGLVRLIVAYGPSGVPRIDNVTLDPTSIIVAFAAGLLVVAICGSVPALAASRTDATTAFRSRESLGSPRRRLQNLLVVTQVAGAMTLVIAAIVLGQSFIRAQAEDAGFPAEHLLIARIERPSSPRFFLEARERLAGLPGVVEVGGITDFLIRRSGDQQITVEARSFADSSGRLPKLVMDSVTPGYFRAMAIDIVEGRDFEDRDLEPGARSVVIVNDAIARRFWPNESAVGKRLVGGSSPPKDGKWATVVGVVRDMRREGLDVSPILSVFMPSLLRTMDMTIRTSTAPETLIPAIRQHLRTIDPALPLPSIVRADARLEEQLGSRRFEAGALVAFAAISLLLAAAGLYASLLYQVTLRRHEIGIRTALGAETSVIVRMFVGQGLRLALIGVVVGTAGALSVAKFLESLLYETPAVSARSYLVAATVVIFTALLAAWQPARRAVRVHPATILRD